VSVLAAKPPQVPHNSANIATTAAQDDEWNFASALPVSSTSTLVLTNSTLQISWQFSRPANQQDVIEIKSKMSNNTSSPISDVTLQVAASKVSLAMVHKIAETYVI
jgi:ADP-ribosylation factor-binding protein GGA